MDLVLLGPPGSGKGTQAKLLAAAFKVPHISTGEIFRKNLSEDTELGHLARQFMDEGALVPDDVTEAMVRERLGEPDAEVGYILDGFPRNLAQGEHFDNMLKDAERTLTAVLYLAVPRAVLVSRLTGRRVCPRCGATYHLEFNPPKTTGLCDTCGSELIQRHDDTEETVLKRLRVYDEETAPLVSFYQHHGLLWEFDGTKPVDEVTRAIVADLAAIHD